MKPLHIIPFLTLMLFTLAAYAQKETPPAGSKAKDFKLPAKQKLSLPNGLKATLVEYGNIPKATVSVNIKTGNVHEAPDEIWLADLTGQMINQGTESLDFAAMSKKVASMGGNLNVSVTGDQTIISGAVLSEYAGDFIRLIADLVQHPALRESDISRLKTDLQRKLQLDLSVPQNIAASLFSKAVFGDTPYGNLYPTTEMIDHFSVEKVKNFYNSNFGAKRTAVYVAGKFDARNVSNAIESSFKNWKAGPEVKYLQPVMTARADTIISDRKGAPQTTIVMGLPVVQLQNPDYLALSITNSLLGGSFASRITSNIREDKGYTYSPFSNIANSKGGSVWREQADVTSANTVDALREINKEIVRLQNDKPQQAELDGIKNYEAGIFTLRNSTPASIISQLNIIDLYGLPDSYLTNMIRNIYSITPEKVSEITKKYIRPEKMTVVMVGDEELIKKQM